MKQFVFLLLCPLALFGQGPQQLLRQTAETYRQLHSYTIAGDLTTTLVVNERPYTVTWTVDITQADETALPTGSAAPMLPQLVRFGGIDWRDGAGNASTTPAIRIRSPRGWAEFDRIDEGTRDVRRLSEETLDIEGRSVACQVVEVLYQPGQLDEGISARPVRYWIDPSTGLVLRIVFRIPHTPLREPLEWTFTARSIEQDKPPPEWALLQLERFAGREVATWIGREAPGFTLAAPGGRHVSLADLRGRVVLLAFWATWCEPCRYEAPMFARLAKEFEGLEVWGITNDPAEKAVEWLASYAPGLRTLLDSRREAQRAYQVGRMIPVTVVVDRAGKVAAYVVGLRGEAYFRAAIERALRRPAQP